MTTGAIVGSFARLRWRLLSSSLGATGTERLGALAITGAAMFTGTVGFTALIVAGPRVDDPVALMTTITIGLTLGALGLGTVTGVSRPIDPRVLAVEPLSVAQRTVGLLTATAVGPSGLAALAIGAGAVVGLGRGPSSIPVITTAVALWLLILLLSARTATELLAALLRRAPRTGYAIVVITAIGLYTLVQLGPALLAGLRPEERARLVELAGRTPIGQLARVMGGGTDGPATTALALGIGVLSVIALTAVHLAIVHRSGTDAGGRTSDHRPSRDTVAVLDRLVGRGPVGVMARRRIQIRFRRPRTALETVAAAGIGMAAVLAPIALRDDPGASTVLLGGAVQLAVLLVAGNSFGNEGPAVVHDLVAGGPRRLIAGTIRSTVILGAPLAVLGPLVAAAITGAWQLLPAGWLVATGALLAGAGGAVVQSVFVPIPLPESDDPFASGESGRTLVAAIAMLVVLVALAIPMAPILVLLMWAASSGATMAVSAAAAASILAGWGLCRAGAELAGRRLELHTPAFVTALTPSR